MLECVDFATLLQYSPRVSSQISKDSRAVKDTIKAGRIEHYRKRITQIVSEHGDKLQSFLNPAVTLVPAPRSSPNRESDLWPSLEICKMLASLNLGETAPCLVRSYAIRKSSLYYNSDQRPSVAEQFDSLLVNDYVPTENITVVDDVLTLGSTSLAAASRLAEKFPLTTIRVFSLIRTMGFIPEVSSVLSVETGTVRYYPSSGKCFREP